MTTEGGSRMNLTCEIKFTVDAEGAVVASFMGDELQIGKVEQRGLISSKGKGAHILATTHHDDPLVLRVNESFDDVPSAVMWLASVNCKFKV